MFISKALVYHNRDWINRLYTPSSKRKYGVIFMYFSVRPEIKYMHKSNQKSIIYYQNRKKG